MNSTPDSSWDFLLHFVPLRVTLCLSSCLCILSLPAYCTVLKNRFNGWIYSWTPAIAQEAIFKFCRVPFTLVCSEFFVHLNEAECRQQRDLFPEDTAPEAPEMPCLLFCLYHHNLSTSLLSRAPPPAKMKMLKVQHRVSCWKTPLGFV